MKKRYKISLSILLLISASIAVDIVLSDRRPPDALRALDTSSNTILYSLDPSDSTTPHIPKAQGPRFHGYLIRKQITLDPSQASIANHIFKNAMPFMGNNFNEIASGCVFQPRHALRVSADGHVFDFLLCYHCGQLQIYRDDQDIAFLYAVGTPDKITELMVNSKN